MMRANWASPVPSAEENARHAPYFRDFAESEEIEDWVAGRQSIRTPEPLFAGQDAPPDVFIPYRPFPLTITSCTWFIALLGIFIVPACGPGELGLKTTSVRQCSPGVNTRPLHRELVWNSGSVEVIEPIVMEAF